jgi:hypothetical protein
MAKIRGKFRDGSAFDPSPPAATIVSMDPMSQLTDGSAVAAEIEPTWTRPLVLVPLFVVISAVAGLFPSFSLGANLLILFVGGGLAWLGPSAALPRRSAPRRLSGAAVWWLLPAAVFVAVEFVNYSLGSTYEHPTLSAAADPLLDQYLVRSAAFFGWLTAFWGLVRR